MHDNTLARALIKQGVDVRLIPLYTPIRTDEDDVSTDEVFFGGINVYLQQNVPFFRHLPRWIARVFDQRWLISWATRKSTSVRAETLGPLAVSMLKGKEGFQSTEVDRLVEWLSGDFKPDVIVFTNMLIAGCAPAIKQRLNAKIVVTLQGDDIFLDSLTEPYKSAAFCELKELSKSVDAYISASEYYANYMAHYLDIDRKKIYVVPLAIDVADFAEFAPPQPLPQRPAGRPPTIGYLARIAPEKGFHLLVDAFLELHRRGNTDVRLLAAGWLGDHRRGYLYEQVAKIRRANAEDQFGYWGAVNRLKKLDFLKSVDLLSVPTTYQEPKGLFVLESLAAGVPVVQPNHGAFPEILCSTGGGVLFTPHDVNGLADALEQLLDDPAVRENLGNRGRQAVHLGRNAAVMAVSHLDLLEQLTAK